MLTLYVTHNVPVSTFMKYCQLVMLSSLWRAVLQFEIIKLIRLCIVLVGSNHAPVFTLTMSILCETNYSDAFRRETC